MQAMILTCALHFSQDFSAAERGKFYTEAVKTGPDLAKYLMEARAERHQQSTHTSSNW